MAEKKLIETIIGKYHKYEIYRSPTTLGLGYDFWIYRDGERYRGKYSDLQSAIDAANKER